MHGLLLILFYISIEQIARGWDVGKKRMNANFCGRIFLALMRRIWALILLAVCWSRPAVRGELAVESERSRLI
ncbi:6-Hydroxy-7-prenyldeoxybrevianamide E synthase notC [Trichinella spiralis]|uniref:6-Hydroxy-7-prenyldeoxybrevianamide E synthase notC n=1 Tax=Trichinella spiralis TaxID=6334 RepID=A0ABR3KU04_TRISP